MAGPDDTVAAQAVAFVRARMLSRRNAAEVVVGRSFEVGRWVESGLDLREKHRDNRDIGIILMKEESKFAVKWWCVFVNKEYSRKGATNLLSEC